jgi:uncharacterized membrane protein (DUF2068 family)
MTDSPSQLSPDVPGRNKWLLLIAIYKLGQALLFIAVGVGLLRLLHKDIEDELTRLIEHLRFNPESKLINFILIKASIVDDRMLRRVSEVFFAYAGLGMVEGIGLYLEKGWAEYLTLIITGSFLPWEIWEVIRRLTWIRAGLLLVNVLVFLYLLKVVAERVRRRRSMITGQELP